MSYAKEVIMVNKSTLVILLLLTVFLQSMYFIIGQAEISLAENRALAVFKPFNIQNFVKGDFQDELEQALKDQVFKRQFMIETVNLIKSENRKYVNYALDLYKNNIFLADGETQEYNTEIIDNATSGTSATASNSSTTYQSSTSKSTTAKPTATVPKSTTVPSASSSTFKNWLVPVGNIYSMNDTDYLTRYPLLENTAYMQSIRIKGNQIKEMMSRHPAVKVYAYYLTKSEDLDWFNQSEKIKSFDYAAYVKANLSANVRFEKMVFTNMNEYMLASNKTDHHWNNQGSDRGYTEIYKMISQDFKLSDMKKPIKELDFNGLEWLGSKSGESGVKVTADKFKAYEYDLGPYQAYLGDEQKEIGDMQRYKYGDINRSASVDHYSKYYGSGEEGTSVKYVFNSNKYNLLLISDSNNKPLRRVLASHFNTTVILDYRALQKYDIDQVINTNKIDIVLFAAQCKYWADTNIAKINNGVLYTFKGYPVIRD